jgi:hypothetical protein
VCLDILISDKAAVENLRGDYVKKNTRCGTKTGGTKSFSFGFIINGL